ncbi:MAG TPA: EAL domain-containing protein [Allosphingosinicella sp.]|nr:EAL domain-containing protein [Allosphingosinicella sp.]
MSNVTLPNLDWRVVFNRATPPGRRGWGRVRAAQINELARAVSAAAWGQAFNAILLLFILSGSINLKILSLWLLAMTLLMLIAFSFLRQVQGRMIHSVSRRAIDRTGYHSVVFGFLWAVPAMYFFPQATHPEQLAICVVTASMMAGAAFIFATVPPAASGYVLIMGASATCMLWGTGWPVVAAIGPVYTVGLLVIIYSSGRAFMQRKCVELALEERTETVSLLLRDYESSDADWLWQTNRKLAFQNVSARFARAIGFATADLEGCSIVDLLERARDASPASAKTIGPLIEALSQRAPFSEVLVPITGCDGTKCIELSARPRFNGQGRFVGYRGVGSDVTEARRAADRIAHMARHDALTGLPNRVQLLDALGEALEQTRDGDKRCAMLLIDLDRFKAVNDSLGHVAGDNLLRQVSSRFEPLITSDMTVGRLGGDEFALVIPCPEDKESIGRLARDIIEALQQPFVYHDQHLFVGASIGIALGPSDGTSVEELIRNADLALYRAKDEGGNDVCFYEPSLHAHAEERRQIELALRTAVERQEFSLVYQPVFDARTSRVKSFEALLRWRSEDLGDLAPMKFIPIAEDTGLIGRIGEWALREACTEAAGWPGDVSVAVNISPLQLQEPGFILALIAALSESGLDPCRLELEITETVFLHITPLTQKVLHQIQALGVRLAIDDFGTGYSSLGYLRDTKFDTLKIDRSFVQAVRQGDRESGAIIRAVVALAGSLGMKTVAEGVETSEQLEIVRQLGCDHIQGYIFSDPLPGSAVRPLLDRDRNQVAA